jgi:hypothetical protein
MFTVRKVGFTCIYRDESLCVVMKGDGMGFVVYNYVMMPTGALTQETENGSIVYNRYGERFFTRTQAQNAFNRLKMATTIVKLSQNELKQI